MPLRNHFSGANGIPQKRSSTFSIKLPRSTGSIATQCQSDLELLAESTQDIEVARACASRSYRSRLMTLFQAATKSRTNFSFASSLA